MGVVWILGFLGFILYRAFNAGMNKDVLFYRKSNRAYDRSGEMVFDSDYLLGYLIVTGAMALTWPFSLPIMGVYKLGQKYSK